MRSRSGYALLGRWWWLPVLVGIAVLGLAQACGGGSGRPQGTPGASPSPGALAATATPREDEELTPDGEERPPLSEDERAGTGEVGPEGDLRLEATPDRIPVDNGAAAGEETDAGGRGTGAGEQSPAGFVPLTPELVAEADGVRVTLKRIADPYDNPFEDTQAGTRFVGFDLTIESAAGGSLKRLRDQDFQLIDAAGAAYGGRIVESVGIGGFGAADLVLAFTVGAGASPSLLRYDPDPANPGQIEFQLP